MTKLNNLEDLIFFTFKKYISRYILIYGFVTPTRFHENIITIKRVILCATDINHRLDIPQLKESRHHGLLHPTVTTTWVIIEMYGIPMCPLQS